MKRNISMPKMNVSELSNRLNRLRQKNKPRLQFPKYVEEKKHYFNYQADKVVLGQDYNKKTIQMPRKRNNLDISDIEGTKPRVIQKQKNVMNHYHNKHKQYNPFAPKQYSLLRSASDSKISLSPQRYGHHVDSLDIFQRQLQQKLTLNPEVKRQVTQSNEENHRNHGFNRNRQATQISSPIGGPYLQNSISIMSQKRDPQRKSLVYNPTFMSNLYLI